MKSSMAQAMHGEFKIGIYRKEMTFRNDRNESAAAAA
jgi:hypothetical protein